ncbi:Protein of unknown function [Lutibacter oricola]|uniref:DUF2809 domain-containing protein n=1 Tax=Lutibacter oricola TaxID=762486 RepID=A0A1H2YXI2_9FLAO|nr:Protein of unknown function [Lutibacter oricola]
MITYNYRYFLTFIIVLITEILIASYCTQPFIRNIFGDFLATILLYCFFKSFLKVNPLSIGIAVLTISFFVEFLQLINIIKILNIENRIIKIIIGTTFSISDLIAYTFGVVTTLVFEKLINSQFSN